MVGITAHFGHHNHARHVYCCNIRSPLNASNTNLIVRTYQIPNEYCVIALRSWTNHVYSTKCRTRPIWIPLLTMPFCHYIKHSNSSIQFQTHIELNTHSHILNYVFIKSLCKWAIWNHRPFFCLCDALLHCNIQFWRSGRKLIHATHAQTNHKVIDKAKCIRIFFFNTATMLILTFVRFNFSKKVLHFIMII